MNKQQLKQIRDGLAMAAQAFDDILNSEQPTYQKPVLPTPAPQTQEPAKLAIAPAVNKVMLLFPENMERLLQFELKEDYVKVSPKQFLGSENFETILSIVRGAGGEYISAGQQSHFRVPRKGD